MDRENKQFRSLGFVGKPRRRPESEQFFHLARTAKQAILVLSSIQPDALSRKKGHSKPDRVFRHSPGSCEDRGFTLVEVLVAIAVLLLGLVPLLQLHVGSLRNFSRAQLRTEASLVARSKLAEILADAEGKLQTQTGRLDNPELGAVYTWETEVSDVEDKMSPLFQDTVALDWQDVRQVTVTVSWMDGRREASLSLSTYHLVPTLEIQKTKRLDSAEEPGNSSQPPGNLP